MGTPHQDIERWARQQRDRFRDVLDDRNHSEGRSIYNNIQKLEDSAQSGKNLRSLHDQMRQIERQLEQAKRAENGYISVHDAQMFYDTFGDYADQLRRNPDF